MGALIVLSLFDYTGIMVKPWADAGYECICVDIQHPDEGRTEGNISFIRLDLLGANTTAWDDLYEALAGQEVFIIGFPVCTDLANSGAKHWEGKAAVNARFQDNAVRPFFAIEALANRLNAAYMMENPRSRAAKLYRKPDYEFNPCDFGGYLPEDDVHPTYPDHIPPHDAYTKATDLWVGNGFRYPMPRPVPEQFVLYRRGNGEILKVSKIVAKTGGKSEKTKNIRSATPRGFAMAVYLANGIKRGD